jgi:hypothetical protein
MRPNVEISVSGHWLTRRAAITPEHKPHERMRKDNADVISSKVARSRSTITVTTGLP